MKLHLISIATFITLIFSMPTSARADATQKIKNYDDWSKFYVDVRKDSDGDSRAYAALVEILPELVEKDRKDELHRATHLALYVLKNYDDAVKWGSAYYRDFPTDTRHDIAVDYSRALVAVDTDETHVVNAYRRAIETGLRWTLAKSDYSKELGEYYMKRGHFVEADILFNQALEILPDTDATHNRRKPYLEKQIRSDLDELSKKVIEDKSAYEK